MSTTTTKTMLLPSPSSSISSGSSRSRLSFLSTSSSSTFSDISLPSPPHSGSKTHAFFASPFPTRPPSPTPAPQPPSSKTHAFFSVPAIDISTPTITTPTFQINLPLALDSSSQPTPRPKDLEPDLKSKFFAEPELTTEWPKEGTLISPNESSSASLRLLKPLGHGAFSSVWLADDLSPVPLVLRSRRSLRDLRRQASLKSPLSALNSAKSPPPSRHASLSRAGSLRKLRARVPGVRPIRTLGLGLDSAPDIAGVNELGVLSSLSRASSTSSTSSSSHPHKHRPPTISIIDPTSPSSPKSGSALSRSPSTSKARLVAVKMTVRGGAEGEGEGDEEREREKERTRVAFVREVEVLRHISHPNITPLLTHFSTPTHHLLVLPYLPGGDLLALVNNDVAWGKLRESVVRRMWAEVCRAVGWMHGVGLVHRDIKLENILLTTPIYTTLLPSSPAPTLADLPSPSAPLIKLTDFGLSRFVDIRSQEERERDRAARRAVRGAGEDSEEEEEEEEGPLLSTRCGSEAYAAPELVMGGASAPPPPPPPPIITNTTLTRKQRTSKPPKVALPPKTKQRGIYDARETDAWACGVVLYALVVGRLPFGEGVGGGGGRGGGGRMARRAWLMRIARGEYEWPEGPSVGTTLKQGDQQEGEEELMGEGLARSEGARRVVGRLLVRDPRRRARVGELWGDEWMGGEGVMSPSERREDDGRGSPSPWWDFEMGEGEDGDEMALEQEQEGVEGEEEVMGEEELEFELALMEAEEEEERAISVEGGVGVGGGFGMGEGWLVDEEGIGEVARREVV